MLNPRTVLMIGLAWLLTVRGSLADQPAHMLPKQFRALPKQFRDHASGTLRADDYQASLPETLPAGMLTRTETDIHWNYQCRFKRDKRSYQAELKSVKLFAVIAQDRSWNSDKENKRLLDHGQGHFDLTQAFALENELRWRREILAGEPLCGTGETEELAKSDLLRRIERRLQAERYLLLERHQDYDRLTNHGRLANPLTEQREIQRLRIRELHEELAKLASPP